MTCKLNCPFPSGRKSAHSKKAFTLIEVLVVVGIIVTMLALALPNFQLGEKQFALARAGQKLAQDMRRAQGLAMSSASFPCQAPQKLKGYGINFEKDSDGNGFYSLRARCVNGASSDEEKEKIVLEKKIKIKELEKDGSPVSSLDVFFYPPDPQTDLGEANEARIILNNSENEISVKINKAGLIYVE